ncbi:Mobile element protein [Streptococcus sp. DD10]|nr:Mobile element protein [Streptococcus sp. DD10]
MLHKENPIYNRNQVGFYKLDELVPQDYFLRKVYEYYDCYLCPENQVLSCSTTNRDGYREYKSDPKLCATCPLLSVCTESKKHQKDVTRYIWKDYVEVCEDIYHQKGTKELYQKRKETVERLFGTAKEYHNLRYTRKKVSPK